jgi:PAS domain S-box-containing protein
VSAPHDSEPRGADLSIGAERFRDALDHIDAYVYMKDARGRYVYANRAALAAFGVRLEEVVGQDDARFFPPESARRIAEVDRRVLAGERTQEELTLTLPARPPRTFLEMKAPLYADAARTEIWGLLGISTDITERRRAEEAAHASEIRLRTLTGNLSHVMLYQVDAPDDATRVFRYISPAARRLHDVEPEDIVRDASVLYRQLVEEEPGSLAAAERDALATMTPFSAELRVRMPSGRERWSHFTSAPERLPDGSVTWYGAETDITATKEAEAARKQLEAELEQAHRLESIGRLAGGIAHDFNNMLGVIIGHAELALDSNDPATLREDLEEILGAARRSAELTRQLLGFARKQRIAPRVLDLNAAVGGTLRTLATLLGEGIALGWRPGEGLWSVRVDPAQLDQILTNLCVNARDAVAGAGSITIDTANVTLGAAEAAAHPDGLAGDFVRLRVRDDGCGMDEATRLRVFEPFFTTKPVGQGTGLGLATVYGIVRQNGGFVVVDSAPGAGTTVSIHLPRHAPSERCAPTPVPTPSLPVGHERVLLVEDEPALLRTTRRMLEQLGYDVVSTSSPAEALRIAAAPSRPFELLVTDVVMPELHGLDLAERVRAISPGVRCLFVSGYPAEVLATHGSLPEGTALLPKPFAPGALAAAVRRALDG